MHGPRGANVGAGFTPKWAPDGTPSGRPLQAIFLDGMHRPRGADTGHRVRTQMGTQQDAVGPTTASQVVSRELYILCGWHTTYSLMAKPKALPTNKKRKAASKGTKTPMKTVQKKLNTSTSKCHQSDASSDAGVQCGAVQRPFLPNRTPNRGAGSVHAPNRAPHRPAPVRSGAEGFSARCTGFEQGPISQKKAFLNVTTDLQVHPDRTYFVTSSKDKTARVC